MPRGRGGWLGRAGLRAAIRLGCQSRSGMNADQIFRQFFRLILDLSHSCTFIVVRVTGPMEIQSFDPTTGVESYPSPWLFDIKPA